MLKRITSFLVVSVLIVVAVSGCGASSSTASQSTPASEKASEAPTEAESAESATVGSETTIEFFNMKTEIVSILEAIISDYEGANPGQKVKLTTVSDASQVLVTRMASGDTPDVFTQWPVSVFWEQVDSGYVMDLTGTGVTDNVSDSAREEFKYNGKEYITPISYNCSGVWYNKQIFDQVGVAVPTTWNEFMEACKKIKDADIMPLIMPAKEADIAQRQIQVYFGSMPTLDAFQSDAKAKKLSLDGAYSSDIASIANKIVELVPYCQSDLLGTGADQGTSDFANGKAAMLFQGSWLLAAIKNANPNIEVGMFPLPSDKSEDTKPIAFPGDMALAIAANTKNPEACKAFVKYFATTEVASAYAQQEGNPSAIKGVSFVAPEFSIMYDDYVSTGKWSLNPDCRWTGAQQSAAATVLQTIYFEKKADSFMSGLVDAFNNN